MSTPPNQFVQWQHEWHSYFSTKLKYISTCTNNKQTNFPARPITFKLLLHHTFLKGESIAGRSLPVWVIQKGIPKKLNIQLVSHASTCPLEGSSAMSMFDSVGDTVHPSASPSYSQSANMFPMSVHTVTIPGMRWKTRTPLLSVDATTWPPVRKPHTWRELKIANNSNSKIARFFTSITFRNSEKKFMWKELLPRARIVNK